MGDDSEYRGTYRDGRPHGDGEVTQYIDLSGSGTLTWTAKYAGQWADGLRDGEGKYEINGGFVYQGQWKANKRCGDGEQIVCAESVDNFGYRKYSGAWKDDMWFGEGTLHFGQGDSYVYKGQFKRNYRDGKGATWINDVLIHHGSWRKDTMYSSKEDYTWLHQVLPGNTSGVIYYGQVSSDCKRVGRGTVYAPSSQSDPAFTKAMNEGRAFDMEDPNVPVSWVHTLYHGSWRDNLPHGEGTQKFKNLGLYTGQFSRGERHGRGTWDRSDGKWIYRPVDGAMNNWECDLMHGVGVLETGRHVHENVIYQKGVCQMPFTEKGPPKSGFDDNFLFGNIVNGSRKVRETLAITNSMSSSMADEQDNRMDDADYTHLSAVSRSLESRDGKVDLASEVPQALVREPTNIGDFDEDIYVTGGTDVNKVLNGLYYRLSGTFGLPVFMLVKKNTSGLKTSYDERYLYMDPTRSGWIIGTNPVGPVTSAPGCAFVEDAEQPGRLSDVWWVWHGPANSMVQWTETKPSRWREVKPIDRPRGSLSVGHTISFILSCVLRYTNRFVNFCAAGSGPEASLVLR